MLAKMLTRSGHRLLGDQPPDGRKYWAARFWDRDLAERDPVLGDHYRAQKADLAAVIEKYAAHTSRVIEFACGTGEFTGMAAGLTAAEEIVALDISEQGLQRTAARVKHPGLRLVHGDFWGEHDLGTAETVMCVDAIHHLGDPGQVMTRMKSFVRPGGTFIGNLWTLDNFHEFQRQRYGALLHLGRSALFLGGALAIKVSGGRVRSASYRTRLLQAREIPPLLDSVFDEVLHLHEDRYFVSFACRVAG
ncbi:class I SAM-dependent methyltransferase [Nonomuraea fastidiosa]|uniref:class I SAM-dependent methyltransferase n=1 Tax=Nonomuraea fastidiosa TaxID=46173 RepID=UPI0036701CA2